MITTDPERVISEALEQRTDLGRRALDFALRTPDLYPAKNIATFIGAPVRVVHAWRRTRGIKKARA